MRLVDQNGTLIFGREISFDIEPREDQFIEEISQPIDDQLSALFFFDLKLMRNEELIDQNQYIFTRERDLSGIWRVPYTKISISKRVSGDQWELEISNTGSTTALFLWLEDGRPAGSAGWMYASDHHYCLFPDDTRSIQVDWMGVESCDRVLKLSAFNIDTKVLVEAG